MKRATLYLLIPIVFLTTTTILKAQDGNSPIQYSNLALQYSFQNFNGDAGTGFFPSVASPNGYGSFVDNPASIALTKNGYFSFSLYNNQVEYENSYLGNTLASEDEATKIGNLGFVYSVPAQQGSFVIGAGFNRLAYQQGTTRIDARNNQSTITDSYKNVNSDYYDIAYETYATDWDFDEQGEYRESIFRIGFDTYPGITQRANVSYTTDIGEYSAFIGTEFKKNFFVGISGGFISGKYSYDRDFLEIDDQNDYDYEFIPSDVSEDSTDIHSILTEDDIDADISGFKLRAGIVYKINRHLNIGASYLFSTTLTVEEEYYSRIITELDDNSTPFESDFASLEPYTYKIETPSELNVGASLLDINGFSFSLAGQFIDYSDIELDLNTIGASSDNDFIVDNYKDVINIKSGISYSMNDQTEFKAGYAYLPGKSRVYEADRNIYSAGLSTYLSRNFVLDVNVQYSEWDDQTIAYDYFDNGGNLIEETISKQSSSFYIQTGLRILF